MDRGYRNPALQRLLSHIAGFIFKWHPEFAPHDVNLIRVSEPRL
jgi:hypothetical protein